MSFRTNKPPLHHIAEACLCTHKFQQVVAPFVQRRGFLCRQLPPCVVLVDELLHPVILPTAIHQTAHQALHGLDCPQFFLGKAVPQVSFLLDAELLLN